MNRVNGASSRSPDDVFAPRTPPLDNVARNQLSLRYRQQIERQENESRYLASLTNKTGDALDSAIHRLKTHERIAWDVRNLQERGLISNKIYVTIEGRAVERLGQADEEAIRNMADWGLRPAGYQSVKWPALPRGDGIIQDDDGASANKDKAHGKGINLNASEAGRLEDILASLDQMKHPPMLVKKLQDMRSHGKLIRETVLHLLKAYLPTALVNYQKLANFGNVLAASEAAGESTAQMIWRDIIDPVCYLSGFSHHEKLHPPSESIRLTMQDRLADVQELLPSWDVHAVRVIEQLRIFFTAEVVYEGMNRGQKSVLEGSITAASYAKSFRWPRHLHDLLQDMGEKAIKVDFDDNLDEVLPDAWSYDDDDDSICSVDSQLKSSNHDDWGNVLGPRGSNIDQKIHRPFSGGEYSRFSKEPGQGMQWGDIDGTDSRQYSGGWGCCSPLASNLSANSKSSPLGDDSKR